MPSPDRSDAAEYAPAVARNRAPILAALRDVLPHSGLVLEIASGTGEHAAYFAQHLPHLIWQPSDQPGRSPDSMLAHRAAAATPNLRIPLALDAAAPDWPIAGADAIVAINMIHIAPWAATLGLMAGAGRLLPPGGPLVLYGPFREPDIAIAASNAAFDADLRRQDPAWGLRSREHVAAAARASGLSMTRRIAMPANNLVLVFTRS